MECCFASYDEFITEYQTYRFDECSNCNGCCELIETDLTCTIEGRILLFSPILVLRCKKCGNEFLPEHTKQMIDGAYRTAVKENQTIGDLILLAIRKNLNIVLSKITIMTIGIITIFPVCVTMKSILSKVS